MLPLFDDPPSFDRLGLAARLREFHNAQSDEFFAPCEAPPVPGAALPFQCLAPAREFRFEDFR